MEAQDFSSQKNNSHHNITLIIMYPPKT